MISIIIPTYNRYNYLLNAINSVKNQTYKNYEILVINDGSSDLNYNKKIEDVTQINLPISSKKKLGYPCGAVPRNEGIKRAKGEYIAFLDDDDIWMPNKLTSQIPYFDNPKVGIVTSQTVFFSENNESIEITHNKKKMPTGNVFSELMENYLLAIDSIIISKKVLSNSKF